MRWLLTHSVIVKTMFEIKFVDIFCSAFGTAAAANGGVIDEKLAEKLLEEEVSSLKDNT